MNTVNGLPAHILLVHAIVVLLPLTALLLVLNALWPAARARLAAPNAALSLVVVILVPITTSAGDWLERRVPQSELLREHTQLGDSAIFYAIPIALLALVIWWRQREVVTVAHDDGASGSGLATRSRDRTYLAPQSTLVTQIVAALAVIVAAAGVYGVYRIGDSGSKAAWTGNFSTTPTERDDGPHD
jgi:hypothetical protein